MLLNEPNNYNYLYVALLIRLSWRKGPDHCVLILVVTILVVNINCTWLSQTLCNWLLCADVDAV